MQFGRNRKEFCRVILACTQTKEFPQMLKWQEVLVTCKQSRCCKWSAETGSSNNSIIWSRSKKCSKCEKFPNRIKRRWKSTQTKFTSIINNFRRIKASYRTRHIITGHHHRRGERTPTNTTIITSRWWGQRKSQMEKARFQAVSQLATECQILSTNQNHSWLMTLHARTKTLFLIRVSKMRPSKVAVPSVDCPSEMIRAC